MPIPENTPINQLSVGELVAIIHEATADSVVEHHCRLADISPAEAKGAFSAIKEIGGNDYDAGICNIRDNHKLLNKVRRVGGKVGVAVFIFVAVTVTGGIFSMAWHGFKNGN